MEPLSAYRIAVPIVFVVCLAMLCYAKALVRFRAMLLGIIVFSLYGMIQDQFSSRLCPEYFTILHPPIPGLTDPTLLGMAWGFLGSWWGGAIVGYLTGSIATHGTRFRALRVRDLVIPHLLLVLTVATATILTAVSVHRHAGMFGVDHIPSLDGIVPRDRQRNALIVACYHFVAYGTSIIGGIVLCIAIAIRRTSTREPLT